MAAKVRGSAQESVLFFLFQAEDGMRDVAVTGVQTCALPISCTGCPTSCWFILRNRRGRNRRMNQHDVGHPVQAGERRDVADEIEVQFLVEGRVASVEIGRASCRERV